MIIVTHPKLESGINTLYVGKWADVSIGEIHCDVNATIFSQKIDDILEICAFVKTTSGPISLEVFIDG